MNYHSGLAEDKTAKLKTDNWWVDSSLPLRAAGSASETWYHEIRGEKRLQMLSVHIYGSHDWIQYIQSVHEPCWQLGETSSGNQAGVFSTLQLQ